MAYAWGRGFVGRDQLSPSRVAQPEGTPVRPWAIAEDQVKVAASASHVEVAISLSKCPLAQVFSGSGAVALPAAVEVRTGPANAEKQHRQSRSSRCAGATPAALSASTGSDDGATGFTVKGQLR